MIGTGGAIISDSRPAFSPWHALLLVAVLTTWISPWTRELFIGDETKYSRVLYELSSSGEWLIPELEGKPYAHKPPGHFWLLGGLETIFGLTSLWTFVLPSLLSFLAACALAAIASKRLVAGRPVVAAAIFGTFWLSWVLAQTARMDMSFVVLITSGSLLMFESFETERRGTLVLAAISFGLAILIKGPMAGVIAIGLYGIERAVRAGKNEPLQRGWGEPVAALAIMLAIPLTWLLPALAAAGPGYGEALLLRQTLGRAFSSWVHAEPPWFYLVRFPLTFFPWFMLVVLGGWHAVNRASGDERRRVRFLLVWFGVVFIAFSLLSGKLDVYMLPAMVPAAVLAAYFLDAPDVGARMTGSQGIVAAIGIVFGLAALTAPALAEADPGLVVIELPLVRNLFVSTAIVAGVGLAVQLRRSRDRSRKAAVLGFVALAPLLYLVVFLIPLANGRASTTPLISALERRGVLPEEIGLYWTPHLWGRAMRPELNRVRYDEPDELRANPPRVVVVRGDHAEDLGMLLQRYRLVETVGAGGDRFDVFERQE